MCNSDQFVNESNFIEPYPLGINNAIFTPYHQDYSIKKASVGLLKEILLWSLDESSKRSAYQNQMHMKTSAMAVKSLSFKLAGIVEGEVSWATAQKVFLYRRY
jgi:hypothetical protein